MKKCKKLSEKFAAKSPGNALSYFIAKIACVKDALSEILKLEASPVEGHSLLQKDKSTQKRKSKKRKINKKNKKPKDAGSQILISAHA